MRKVSKSKPNNILRQRNFIKVIKRINIEIRFYTKYIKVGETCVVNREFDLYARYLKNTRKLCDLVVF